MIYNIVEGFARIELDNKWGFINSQCEITTKLKYDFADDYINGYAQVKLGRKWTYLDVNSEEVVNNNFSQVK